jgi:hypothetical protein
VKGKIKMVNFKKISNHSIRIRHTINGGMIVKVGCAELIFNNYIVMLEAMREFYDDPQKMESAYNKAMSEVNGGEPLNVPTATIGIRSTDRFDENEPQEDSQDHNIDRL